MHTHVCTHRSEHNHDVQITSRVNTGDWRIRRVNEERMEEKTPEQAKVGVSSILFIACPADHHVSHARTRGPAGTQAQLYTGLHASP
jgi:hypothetical protein